MNIRLDYGKTGLDVTLPDNAAECWDGIPEYGPYSKLLREDDHWNYTAGIAAKGIEQVGMSIGDKRYEAYVKTYIDRQRACGIK